MLSQTLDCLYRHENSHQLGAKRLLKFNKSIEKVDKLATRSCIDKVSLGL